MSNSLNFPLNDILNNNRDIPNGGADFVKEIHFICNCIAVHAIGGRRAGSGSHEAAGDRRLGERAAAHDGARRAGYKGMWLERTYRTSGGTPFRAIWVEGAGAKGWEANEMSSDDGEIWGGETSEKVTVAGHNAMLEYRPVVGYSLIVKIGKDGVLTLESQVATKDALTEAAGILIKNMK